MALRTEKKLLRQVKRHTRKSSTGRTVYVTDYWQRYDKPRGEWGTMGADRARETSKTMWLKDRHGRFVGRANAAKKTRARGAVMGRLDTTRNVRERGRYGRIKGRTQA